MAKTEIITVAKNAADAWRGTDTYHQAAQIIDMLVSELEGEPILPHQNEWMSVDERLPEDDVPKHKAQIAVLVLTDRETVKIKNRTYHPSRFYYGKFYPARWDWGTFNDDRITHWMPLPAPPDRRQPEKQEDKP